MKSPNDANCPGCDTIQRISAWTCGFLSASIFVIVISLCLSECSTRHASGAVIFNTPPESPPWWRLSNGVQGWSVPLTAPANKAVFWASVLDGAPGARLDVWAVIIPPETPGAVPSIDLDTPQLSIGTTPRAEFSMELPASNAGSTLWMIFRSVPDESTYAAWYGITRTPPTVGGPGGAWGSSDGRRWQSVQDEFFVTLSVFGVHAPTPGAMALAGCACAYPLVARRRRGGGA